MYNNSFCKSVFYLSLISSMVSCSTEYVPVTSEAPVKESELTAKSYDHVDRALWSYFEAFEEEAAKHDLNVDLEQLGITGVIKEISESGVAGTCQYGQHIHHVTIDKSFWNQFSTTRKEMVVFHELGHCVLGRGHYEAENDNGFCLSIMNSGTSGCDVIYNLVNRDYYLQELFSGSTP